MLPPTHIPHSTTHPLNQTHSSHPPTTPTMHALPHSTVTYTPLTTHSISHGNTTNTPRLSGKIHIIYLFSGHSNWRPTDFSVPCQETDELGGILTGFLFHCIDWRNHQPSLIPRHNTTPSIKGQYTVVFLPLHRLRVAIFSP